MTACEAELCPYWTGQGCACEVFGIDEGERRAAEWGQPIDPEPIPCPRCEGTGSITSDRYLPVDCGECLGEAPTSASRERW